MAISTSKPFSERRSNKIGKSGLERRNSTREVHSMFCLPHRAWVETSRVSSRRYREIGHYFNGVDLSLGGSLTTEYAIGAINSGEVSPGEKVPQTEKESIKNRRHKKRKEQKGNRRCCLPQ
jgi:hypothetical protein